MERKGTDGSFGENEEEEKLGFSDNESQVELLDQGPSHKSRVFQRRNFTAPNKKKI